jgi:DNA-binding MarR family transcriptional regulator
MARDGRLVYLLHRAARVAVGHVTLRTQSEVGVSAVQLGTLSQLAMRPGSTMTSLAEQFDLNKSAMSGMVARLERDGLIVRKPNPGDARGSLLFLTKKGDGVRAGSRAVFQRATAELTDGFSSREMDVVIRFLNALVERFSEAEAMEAEQ